MRSPHLAVLLAVNPIKHSVIHRSRVLARLGKCIAECLVIGWNVMATQRSKICTGTADGCKNNHQCNKRDSNQAVETKLILGAQGGMPFGNPVLGNGCLVHRASF